MYSHGRKKAGLGAVEVTEKATGAKLGRIGIASPQDISAAAASAREAQKEWARMAGPKRGDVLREFSRLLIEHSQEVADQLGRETGSIRAKAQWEVQITPREFLEAAALAGQPQGIVTATLEAGFLSMARRVPLGVIGIITPWNSPIILAARAIGPALAMGNAVILKPDIQTPIAGGVIFARLLEKAGLPSGLFHVLPGGPETGAALVKEPLVNMVSFTGSTRVARPRRTTVEQQVKKKYREKGRGRGGLATWQLKCVAAYIEGNMDSKLRAADLAAIVRLSATQFSRAFKKSFAETPLAYVTRQRMRRAQVMMLSSREPLSRIAVDCGMCDQAHFTRTFRKVVGITPSVWRREFSPGREPDDTRRQVIRGASPSDIARPISIFPLPRSAAHSPTSRISTQEETPCRS
jgi:AraC-like DNA-binding protein